MTSVLALSAVLAVTAVQLVMPTKARRARGSAGRAVRLLAVALPLGAVLASGLNGHRLALGAIAAAVAFGALRSVASMRAEAAARRRAELAMTACEAVAGELDAGRPPSAALGQAARDWPELAPVVAAAHLDADVPTALRAVADRPGAASLRAVAATWQVAHRNGSGLADALERTVQELRAEQATRRVVAAELASARATAWLIAGLPGGVLLFGSGLGGDPFGFLTSTTPGLVCLAAGCALSLLGLTWLQAISRRVLR